MAGRQLPMLSHICLLLSGPTFRLNGRGRQARLRAARFAKRNANQLSCQRLYLYDFITTIMISSQQDERSNLPSDHMVAELSAFREDNDMKIITSTVLALSLTARSFARRTRGSFLLHSQKQR